MTVLMLRFQIPQMVRQKYFDLQQKHLFDFDFLQLSVCVLL